MQTLCEESVFKNCTDVVKVEIEWVWRGGEGKSG